MGGSGGGGYIPSSSDRLREQVGKAEAKERERLESDVNAYLMDVLATFNERDVDTIREHLARIEKLLAEDAEIDQLLLGGSVAKHTFVDGLSDVDALVILDRSSAQSPQQVLDEFHAKLDGNLTRDVVRSVEKGTLAVTVTYLDGTEIQLLPAIRSGNKVSIADANGNAWKATDPKSFQAELTKSNQRLNNCLVPTIKLVKSIVADFPAQKQITGYHAESLALDAAKGYRGPKTPKALLVHTLEHAAERVLKPIRDVTGQNRNVDSYLGRANSAERRNVALALAGVARRLDMATSLGQWKALFEDR